MNQIIKFRVWDEFNKCFIYSEKCECFCDFSKTTCSMSNSAYHNDKYVYSDWMQFIGRQDEDGKDIYSGDIVIMGGQKSNRHYQVAFRNNSFGLLYSDNTFFTFGDMNTNYAVGLDYKVVGNVYENPELLSEEKNGL